MSEHARDQFTPQTMTGPGLRYEIEVLKQRRWTGTFNERRLAEILNGRAAGGWKLSRTIASTYRVWLVFRRESHFLIFERAG